MPYMESMNWVKSRKQWTRMHKGKRVWVSAVALCGVADRDASRASANQFWDAWLATNFPALQPALHDRLWCKAFDDAPVWMSGAFTPFMYQRLRERVAAGEIVETPDVKPVEPSKTLGHVVGEWFSIQQAKVAADTKADGTYKDNRKYGKQIMEHFGENFPVENITETTVAETYKWVIEVGQSGSWQKHCWSVFGRIVQFSAERKLCPLPSNMKSREWSFKVDQPVKDYWSPELFRLEFSQANDFGKLVLLCAANYGFNQADMAEMQWDGTALMTHRRVKTRNRVEEETFHSWPETMEYLGKALHLFREGFEENTKGNYASRKHRIGAYSARFAKNLKWLRHTGAKFLGENEELERYADQWMMHKSKKMRHQAYYKPPIPKAVTDYLRSCYLGV